MKFKREIAYTFIALSALLLMACGKNTVNSNAEKHTVESDGNNVVQGADVLGGSWYIGAIYYKNNLIDIHDVDAIESMYDGVVLTFNEDGTFVYIDKYNYKGEYIKYEKTESECYLLKATSRSRYTLENGMIAEKDEEDTERIFIVTLLDENTLEMCDYDSVSGKAKADASPLVFVKEFSEGYIEEHKVEISNDKQDVDNSAVDNSQDIQKDDSDNAYSKPAFSIKDENVSSGKRNALNRALEYLDYMAFSYTGLIEQLEFEGFTKEEATYGADNCGADWNEQAVKKAEEYLDYMSFSYSGLVDQLEFEGFTHSQAEYGASEAY